MRMNSASRLELLLPSPVSPAQVMLMLSVARRLAVRNPLQTVIGAKSLSSSHECRPCLGVVKLPRMQSFTVELLLKCVFYLM